MNNNISLDPISLQVTVKTSRDRAFDVFLNEFSSWYPRAYTWSQDKLDTIELGTAEGERCFERGPHNFRIDWGRVLTLRPPERIVFTWQISPNREPIPDPNKASEVEVSFKSAGKTTMVELEHRSFRNHGEGAEQYREALASSQGWPFILEHFQAFVEE